MPLVFHHRKSVSNTTQYFTIPWDSNPPIDCPHIRFEFILNDGASTNW